jgi:hypothetical protein
MNNHLYYLKNIFNKCTWHPRYKHNITYLKTKAFKLFLNLFPFCKTCAYVMCVNGLGLTLHVSVNPTMKFIYIHIRVSANVEYEMCKCKNKFIYVILRSSIYI